MGITPQKSDHKYQHIQVKPLVGALGAEISNVDLGNLTDEIFEEVRTAFYNHQVIVFRDQNITTDDQKSFGSRFGELSIHPFSPNRAENPEVIILDYGKDNPPALTDQWHADETFREAPPMGTILYAKVVPDVGGDTMFASMGAAYDGLSDRMKAHIEGLVGEHDFLPWRPLFGKDPEGVKRLRELEDKYPKQWHPIVRVHPVTGRKTLYASPQFVTHVVGLPSEESAALLDYLFLQARVPENQLRVNWKVGTLVMWDNAAVQHYAVHDYYPQKRSMERVTIKGERPIGPIDESMLPEGALPGRSKSATASNSGVVKRQFERQ